VKKTLLLAAYLLLSVLLASGYSLAVEQKLPAVKPVVEKKAEVTPAMTSPEELLDINSASEEQLKKIAGIGDEYAKKIIAGRPYVKKDQLKSRKILSPALYDKVKDKIIAKKIKGDEK